jgi:lipopolysaccharide transport protein LptA/LPS export ABC transporter protein LptC
MKNRNIIVYVSAGFIVLCFLSALYFFAKKPERIAPPVLEDGKKAIVFKDVKYSGEKKGVVDWEIKAKIARKFIDKPEVELEIIEGQYMPKADVNIAFKGAKGVMNTEAERGIVEDVEIVYKKQYTLKSKSMDFDFKRGITSTTAPVDIKGNKLSLRGVGLTANTNEETVRIEKDVTGFIETDKGRYKFESDTFLYLLKTNVYILDGKVVMKGEDLNLVCDNLRILSKGQELERIDAKGKVRLISKGTITKSEKAVYNFKEEKIVLTESPRILKDNIEMEGESIVYNMADGKFSIDKPRMRLERQ